MLAGLVVIGLMNGLVLLPVILSVFGPPGEVGLIHWFPTPFIIYRLLYGRGVPLGHIGTRVAILARGL